VARPADGREAEKSICGVNQRLSGIFLLRLTILGGVMPV
jgi:hypothetical protein